MEHFATTLETKFYLISFINIFLFTFLLKCSYTMKEEKICDLFLELIILIQNNDRSVDMV